MAVHLSFGLLFAFVLPFICWGVLETPGHAHRSVHFVFGQPPGADISTDAALRRAFLASWCGSTSEGRHWERALVEPEADNDTSNPGGRSVPWTALSGMLLPAAVPSLAILSEPPAFGVALSQENPDSTDLSVPTPPPRVAG